MYILLIVITFASATPNQIVIEQYFDTIDACREVKMELDTKTNRELKEFSIDRYCVPNTKIKVETI